MTKHLYQIYKGFRFLTQSEKDFTWIEIFDSNFQFRDATTSSVASVEAKTIEAKTIVDKLLKKL